MDRDEKAKYESRANVLKALAHPARLKLIDVLAEHDEVCVCDLTEAIGTDMSTVSRHLTQLKNAGIVQSEKQGQMVFYRLKVKCLSGLFDCIESVLHGHLKSQLKVLSD
ncbi:putative HTH-type transcriptional regulator [Planctomycetes bacterium CA13]|uniref:Putative HTH-type transcriptional regulator n=1 Tax=Novipirellula herctigrandis TaxID=2527986 RepID=A0A5C5Z9U5_9BACT|nr:putative HTH-type transcriptional regulator [Planctomycetes bacterium CA13]